MLEIGTLEGKIMQLRALGYSQQEIAVHLNMSQSAISQKLEIINARAKKGKDLDKAFWTFLLGAGALYLLLKSLDKK